jgi:hypothetical protein
MSRTKNTAIKQMSPDNDPLENLKLAEVGDMWHSPGFAPIFFWRFALAFCKYLGSEAGKKEAKTKQMNQALLTVGGRLTKKTTAQSIKSYSESYKAAVQKEIGKAVGHAIEDGDWRTLDSLAKATKFVADRWDWQVNCANDLILIKSFDVSKFQPRDRLRMVMIREWMTEMSDDAVKKSRRAFMKHVAAILGREINAAFAKTFDRACTELGILRRKKVDNSSRAVSKT